MSMSNIKCQGRGKLKYELQEVKMRDTINIHTSRGERFIQLQ